jgi:hypothetical protein
MRLNVQNKTRFILRNLARGDKSMGKFLDDLAPALQAEREHIESGGGDRSPITRVLRAEMFERERRAQLGISEDENS